MHYTVYETTNNINGKTYIGMHSTKDIADNYLGTGKLMRLAINKYGSKSFTKQILHVFDTRDEMIAKEIELVNEDYVARPDTYNLMPGGHGGAGHVQSEEHKQKRSIAQIGREIPESTKERMRGNTNGHANKGRISPNIGNKYTHAIVECPHCNKTGGQGNMKRWHFDNCRAT